MVAPLLAWAQPHQNDATVTKPFTVVYKLKQQAATGRVSGDVMQQALQQVKAKNVHREFSDALLGNTSRLRTSPDISRIYELTYSESLTFDAVKKALMATGMVEYVEPLYQHKPFYQPNDQFADSTKTNQYYLKLIGAYEAWNVEKGDTNVVIGVLDTGFRLTHEDLARKIKRNYKDPVDGLDNDGDGYIDNFEGWDFADNDNNVIDDTQYNGHGTSVAAVAAAEINNSVGIAGVGHNIQFMPFKVFSSSPAGNFGGYEALLYAASKGCQVINLSWGGEFYSQYEQDVINYVVLEKNVVVVASGGNSNGNKNFYPASYNNVLSVGGTTSSDVKYSGYTYSYNIDISAPSRSVHTAANSSDKAYGGGNGTSFAAPMVSAAAALVKSKYPTLSAGQIMERLRVSSDDIYHLAGNQPYLEMLGKGRLNIKKALKQQQLTSVRCTNFAFKDRYLPTAGGTATINATFTNYLSPTTNLEVILSTASPYVTVTKSKLSLGAIGTMRTSGANGGNTFEITLAEDAPTSLAVDFRLGYKDGAYEDYQYFKVVLNPDVLTLDINNLKVSLNSKGNLGFNGFDFTQGNGVVYKNNGPLLFEGGLILAKSATAVSDNMRAEMWENDEDFIPTSVARRHINTPLAVQEIRHVMNDNRATANEENIGVQVKQIAYAWDSPNNEDYIVVEYHIKNTTEEPIEKLQAGLFADWDIGDYYANFADWDDESQVGYVYASASSFPYTGVKLLSSAQPNYYAIDNNGAAEDELNIEDSFTSEEKYKVLAEGINRRKAGGKTGNNVAHAVSATVSNLAPNETRIVAFAVLAGDNLNALKANAMAAQQKYNSFRTSPAPLAKTDTLCAGTNATWAPAGGGKVFNFYADQNKTQLLATGPTYTIEPLTSTTVIYAASIDSLFESAAVPAEFALPKTPIADFEVAQDKVYVGQPVTFINKSMHAKDWRWNPGTAEPLKEKDLIYTFDQAGTYTVKLTVADRFNCEEVSVTKTVEVQTINPTSVANALHNTVTLYPNPTTGMLYVKADDLSLTAGVVPTVTVTDMVGRRYDLQVSGSAGTARTDISALPAGVYIAHITYQDKSIVKRVVLLAQ